MAPAACEIKSQLPNPVRAVYNAMEIGAAMGFADNRPAIRGADDS